MTIGQGSASSNQRRHAHVQEGTAVGFFTDATTCIGCKACEVACKEWNDVPACDGQWSGRSYDNTGALGASSWRHVMFLERDRRLGDQITGGPGDDPLSWIFLSDVCKHCEEAGCLEACPTGSIIRVENQAVYVQDDVCNGCGYCVVTCPFGVIDTRPKQQPGGGGAFKCTFCYDRQIDGLTPACAKACPTESIQFGPLDEMRRRARDRAAELREAGAHDAQIYDPTETSVGGIHALSLVIGDPRDYGLPRSPEVPTVRLRGAWISALATAAATVAAAWLAFGVT